MLQIDCPNRRRLGVFARTERVVHNADVGPWVASDPLADPGRSQRASVPDHLEVVKRAADAGAACRAGPTSSPARQAGRASRVSQKSN